MALCFIEISKFKIPILIQIEQCTDCELLKYIHKERKQCNDFIPSTQILEISIFQEQPSLICLIESRAVPSETIAIWSYGSVCYIRVFYMNPAKHYT